MVCDLGSTHARAGALAAPHRSQVGGGEKGQACREGEDTGGAQLSDLLPGLPCSEPGAEAGRLASPSLAGPWGDPVG